MSNNSKDSRVPGNGSDDLFEVFNKHFDDYLQKYGVATPKAPVVPFPKKVVPVKAEPVEIESVVEEVSEPEAEPVEVELEAEPVEVEPEVEELSEAEHESVEVSEPVEIEVEPEVAAEYFEVEPEVEEFSEPVEAELEAEYFESEVELLVEEPEAVVEPEDEYFEPEEEDFSLTDDGAAPELEPEEDLFYDPEEVVEEEPAPPVAPVIEREILREVLVVDREQARDLGYSADRYLGEKAPQTSKPLSETPAPNVFPRASQPAPEPSPEPYAERRIEREETRSLRSDAPVEKKKSGWFGRRKEEAPAKRSDSSPRYEEKSRVKEEGIDSGTGFIPIGAESSSITLKTQDGYDARDERLRLQHVNTEKRDVDPAVWLEGTMLDALKLDASDLHIIVDGETRDLHARIRVDGQMRDFDYVQGVPARVIMGRLKAATELSSGGSFEPEETIYTIDLDGEPRKARAVLFRVEDGGEALVMRLPLTGRLKELKELDFAEYNLELVTKLLAMPYKLIMIAGPMGSGKTTTAHGALLHVAKPTRTVWTIEDPVERRLPNMVQLEIDEENGAGFDVLLSKLLRADYNTLFLGEIRDNATASAAVRQSKAGRQVMSTIHADDNIKALMRLIELAGDSPLSVLSAVGGVISQRLVRRLNPAWDGVDPNTKYKGRVPVHEILFINDEIIEVMMSNRPLSEIKQATTEAVGSTFSMDAHRLIDAGITDREELTMVIGEFE